uniref:Secreted protein n=1 Tax=Anguilla anguilla TaxID=7936 RepID=A0A0E9WGX8_ANGAN
MRCCTLEFSCVLELVQLTTSLASCVNGEVLPQYKVQTPVCPRTSQFFVCCGKNYGALSVLNEVSHSHV